MSNGGVCSVEDMGEFCYFGSWTSVLTCHTCNKPATGIGLSLKMSKGMVEILTYSLCCDEHLAEWRDRPNEKEAYKAMCLKYLGVIPSPGSPDLPPEQAE